MRKKISYCTIQGDSIFNLPTETHSEVVEFFNNKNLEKHITSQKDEYGHSYKKSTKNSLGFDYISNAGGVRVLPFIPHKIIQI